MLDWPHPSPPAQSAIFCAASYFCTIRRSRPVISPRLAHAQNAQQRRRDIAQRTSALQLRAAVFGQQNERDGIRGVIGVRAAGDRINHRFGVAVIGGDNPRAAARPQRLKNSSQAFVHRFAGLDRRFELP